MRLPLVLATVCASSAIVIAGQSTPAASVQDQLKRLFPSASSISPKAANPPHFKIFQSTPSGQALAGVAFLTTELEPLERGYDGPIKMLVGLSPDGKLTGVLVLEHHEPYGYFSVETPEFAAQFVGKDIRDPFKIGSDVDAVSRATVTMTSAARAIRNSARRVARQVLTPPEAR